ncbi:MAG: hypothetical protein WBB67_01670 [bacterium]
MFLDGFPEDVWFRLSLSFFLVDGLLPTLAYTMLGAALFIHAPQLADESGVRRWGNIARVFSYCTGIIFILISINAFPNFINHWVDLSIGIRHYIEAQALRSWESLIIMVIYEFCIPFFAGIFGIMILIFIIKNNDIPPKQHGKSKYRMSILFMLSGLAWVALGAVILGDDIFGNIGYVILWNWEIPGDIMGRYLVFLEEYWAPLFSILVGWFILRVAKFGKSSAGVECLHDE